MYYSGDEEGWIERKAQEIARDRGWPLPMARSEAIAELRRLQDQPKAPVCSLNVLPRYRDPTCAPAPSPDLPVPGDIGY